MIIKKEKSYQKMSTLKVGHLNMYAQMKIKLERFRWFFLLEILADVEDVQYHKIQFFPWSMFNFGQKSN